jgi:Caspase domain/WD domain, G-beta repeat
MPSVDEPVFVPAPELPPGPRNALVIATNSYTDPQLGELRSPARDAEDLVAVLADPAIGGFKVTQLIDQTESRIRREIAAFLHGRSAEETVLIYLSCHGIQDARGRLLFAATDTETIFPHASAVRAAELLDELDECGARRQILILDCCFSGSFSGNKGGRKGELDLERQFRGHSRGREVLTASRGFEYSFEGEPLGDEITGSVFTTGLVEGLRTGAADTDRNGHITVEEAYEYAFAYVQRDGSPQTPQRWLSSGEGSKIVLARSAAGRAVTPAKLPEHVVAALESGSPHVRIGGVNALAEWLLDPDPARRLAAVQALQEAGKNDIRRVAEVANAHLRRVRPPVTAPVADDTSSQARHGEPWIPHASAAVLYGHKGRVWSVAFSPDGELLASGGRDGTVRMRKTATGAEVHVLGDKRTAVWCVAFSPDGVLSASAGEAGTIRVWQAAAGTYVDALSERAGWVWSVAFSPDGVLLASGGGDGVVRVWDAATGDQLRVLEGHAGWIYGVAFSPDGVLLASGGGDGVVRVWDAATGDQLRVLEGHSSPACGVAFSPNGVLLASAGEDGTVRVWEAATGKQIRILQGHDGPVWGVAFNPVEPLLASAGQDGTVRLWR